MTVAPPIPAGEFWQHVEAAHRCAPMRDERPIPPQRGIYGGHYAPPAPRPLRSWAVRRARPARASRTVTSRRAASGPRRRSSSTSSSRSGGDPGPAGPSDDASAGPDRPADEGTAKHPRRTGGLRHVGDLLPGVLERLFQQALDRMTTNTARGPGTNRAAAVSARTP